MATYNAIFISSFKYVTELRKVLFTGTTKKVINEVLTGVPRNLIFSIRGRVVHKEKSGVDGSFSIMIACAPTDLVRVVCVGDTGEASEIFENILGA